MKLTPFLLSTLYYLLSTIVHAAPKLVPVGQIQMLGGQWFFDGSPSSLGGNFSMNYTPSLKFSERFSLAPTYLGNYRGTKDVQELAGGGTLFQDSMSHGLILKGIYGMNESLKLKTYTSYRTELLREVKGEDWGDGLFDWRKFSIGTEAEWRVAGSKGSSFRLGYDFYSLNFPNYQSLESAQDPTLSRELAGTDVLNSNNHMLSLAGQTRVLRVMALEWINFYTRRTFAEQPIVNASGDLTASKRADNSYSMANFLYTPFKIGNNFKFVVGAGYTYSMLDSNQNHYDARKTTYVQDYYSYKQHTISPELTMLAGTAPWKLTLGGSWQKRNYDSRLIQNENGDFLSDKLYLNQISTGFGMAYPVSKSINFKSQFTLSWSDSNMKYEKVYRYNYKIANYLVGFSYEY